MKLFIFFYIYFYFFIIYDVEDFKIYNGDLDFRYDKVSAHENNTPLFDLFCNI